MTKTELVSLIQNMKLPSEDDDLWGMVMLYMAQALAGRLGKLDPKVLLELVSRGSAAPVPAESKDEEPAPASKPTSPPPSYGGLPRKPTFPMD